MWALGVVVDEPDIKIGLQRLDTVVEVLAQLDAEELVEDSAVEALDKAVGLWRSNLGAAMVDAVEVEVELIRVPLRAAELAAVVGVHRADGQAEMAVEGQDLVVQHRHSGLGLFGDVQETEGVRRTQCALKAPGNS